MVTLIYVILWFSKINFGVISNNKDLYKKVLFFYTIFISII